MVILGIIISIIGIAVALYFGIKAATKKDIKEVKEEIGKINRYLNGWIKLLPTDIKRITFEDGIKAMDSNQWNEAIATFRSLLLESEGSKKVALLGLIGICFYQQEELEQALGHYDESLDLATKISEKEGIIANLNNIGLIYDKQGDFDKAIDNFTKTIEINPNDADAYYNRGIAYGKKGEFDKAIVDFTKAIEINPKYADAYNNRGMAYRKKGELDKAIADYTKTIEINSNDADAYNNRGIAYGKKGEDDKALADFTKAIEINPNLAEAMANLGKTYQLKANKEKAKYWYEQALKNKDHLTPEQIQLVQKWLKELEGK
jgi:tetratricopeptide (TPR) repeat protein